MEKKEKKFKMAKEAATAEFESIVDCFGFNVSMESTKRVVNMDMNNIPMQIEQEIYDADAFVTKIMKGIISFDEESEEIIYHLRKPITTVEGGTTTTEFRFGQFTRAKQMSSGVPLTKCNFGTLPDKDQNKLIMALTGVSDNEILNKLSTAQFNDLRMIGNYYFS
jgi:hypothetical protein